MTHWRDLRHRFAIRAAAIIAAGVLLATSLSFAPTATAGQPLTADSVKLSVLRVTPSTPALSHTPQPLTVVLELTNTTDQSIAAVTVDGERGDPINNQQALDQAIAKPQPPEAELAGKFDAVDKLPVTAALGPRGKAVVSYRSSTDIPTDAGLCLCHDAIYPLYFIVHTVDAFGGDTVVGSGQTYLPAFKDKPRPVQVSWVWPIIDRPHRLIGDTAFTDDELAFSVSSGRLDRVLRVVEQAGKVVPMTLIIDPELIDELAVMSSGPYQYRSAGKAVPGTGSSAAAAWLSRLRAALRANPAIAVDLTPPADPDVESLTEHGLAWSLKLGELAQARVAEALGGHPTSSDVTWPADGSLSNDTLDTLVRQGTRTVILSDTSLPGPKQPGPPRNALASLQTPAGQVFAAVTSSSIQRYVGPALAVGGIGAAAVPDLVAEVAIRAAQDPTTSHYVLITAPRAIDPSRTAAQAIIATAHAFWSSPLPVGAAVPPAVVPGDHGALQPPAPGAPALSPLTITAAQDLGRVVPALTTMLSSADAATLLGALPEAVQRAESTSWRGDPAAAAGYVDQLGKRIDAIESGVEILKPSSGTYTLASSNSPLPVTIVNHLNVAVSVRVRVTPVNGLPGFSATELGVQTIAARDRLPLHIPTHVVRTGRFVVQAALYTPSDLPIGDPVDLSVHSTALGSIGVIITIAAAAVLVLALLMRLIRRVRNPVPAPGTEPPLIAP